LSLAMSCASCLAKGWFYHEFEFNCGMLYF
jgi:hypothetical protein